MSSQITYWEPVTGALSLRDAMDWLFQDSFVRPRAGLDRNTIDRPNTLPVDMYETADQVIIRMVVPGAKVDDIDMHFIDGRLVVDANVPAPSVENATYHYRELGHGAYHREVSLPLPIDTEKVEAVLENGYLTLRLPKADEVKPKKIQVQAR